MSKQRYELKNDKIRSAFLNLKENYPERLTKRLKLSWSNWGFGMESLADSAKRLQKVVSKRQSSLSGQLRLVMSTPLMMLRHIFGLSIIPASNTLTRTCIICNRKSPTSEKR